MERSLPTSQKRFLSNYITELIMSRNDCTLKNELHANVICKCYRLRNIIDKCYERIVWFNNMMNDGFSGVII